VYAWSCYNTMLCSPYGNNFEQAVGMESDSAHQDLEYSLMQFYT